MIHLLLESNKLELLNELYSLTLNVKRHTLGGEICGKLPVWAIAQFFCSKWTEVIFYKHLAVLHSSRSFILIRQTANSTAPLKS